MSVNRYKDGQLTLIAGSGDSNTFTGTKAEVEQAIAAGKIKENWTVYITDDLEDIVNPPGGSNCDCKVEYLTQEQYDALPEDKLTNDIEYRITDNNPATPSAKNMAYDGTASGLEANNVQDAIDAVNGSLEEIGTVISIANSTTPSAWNWTACDHSQYKFIYAEVSASDGIALNSALIPIGLFKTRHNNSNNPVDLSVGNVKHYFCVSEHNIGTYMGSATYAIYVYGVK